MLTMAPPAGKMSPPLLLLLLLLLSLAPHSCFAGSTQREMTAEIPPGKEECFFETIGAGETLDVDYQVVDGGSQNELEINFKIVKPSGIPLAADFRRSDNVHRNTVQEAGDYRICFDNSMSRFSAKVVYFEVIVERDDDDDDDDNFQNLFGELALEGELYDVKVEDIKEVLKSIKERMGRSRHFQDQIRAHEFRDRSIAENNFERVNFWSTFQVSIMLFAGVVQVVLVRSLFDESSYLHGLWKVLC